MIWQCKLETNSGICKSAGRYWARDGWHQSSAGCNWASDWRLGVSSLVPIRDQTAVFNPGSACSGCRSGAGARSSQNCRGQRQTAATPAHRLRLSLHKVRLRRPLRHLFATPCSGTSPSIRRSRSESRAGFCAMASRSARVWGGTPVWITARTCKPCALRTGKARTLHFRSQIIFGEILIYILALLCATLGTAMSTCVFAMRNPWHWYAHPGLE